MLSIPGICSALSVVATVAICASCSRSDPLGHFEGEVQTQWLDDGRRMMLLSDFAYVQADRTRWPAGAGEHVDGASIPQVFWSFIGGPFEGKYRNASIVHDVACQKKDRDWRAVHRMFREACLSGGVSDLKAGLMYAAVFHFGPRWGADQDPETRMESDDDYERLQLLVTTESDLDVTEIERLTPQALRERVPRLPERAHTERLALPHFEETLTPRTGRVIRGSREGGALEVFVPDEQDRRGVEGQLHRMRASAASEIDRRASRVEALLGANPAPQERERLASELLSLSRERAAVMRVDVRVRVGNAPPR